LLQKKLCEPFQIQLQQELLQAQLRQQQEQITQQMQSIISCKDPLGDNWAPDVTAFWIHTLNGFQMYAPKFLENKITGKVLLKLDQNSLESRFGMPFGDAISFLDVITELKQPSTQSSPSPVIATSHSTRSPAFSPAPVSGPTSEEEETSQLWYADEKIGLVITMSQYENNLRPLLTSTNDGNAMEKFLAEDCKFKVTKLQEIKDENTIEIQFNSINEILKNNKAINKKTAVFVYYSGDGILIDGFTKELPKMEYGFH